MNLKGIKRIANDYLIYNYGNLISIRFDGKRKDNFIFKLRSNYPIVKNKEVEVLKMEDLGEIVIGPSGRVVEASSRDEVVEKVRINLDEYYKSKGEETNGK